MSLASDVPDMVRPTVIFVILSEFDVPVSSVASRFNASGVFMEVSIVMLRLAEDADTLPATSVATAVTACTLLADRVMSIVHTPEPLASVVPLTPS